MSVGWPGICYSRRVSRIYQHLTLVLLLLLGQGEKELVDRLMFHQISHPAGTICGGTTLMTGSSAIHPSILPPVSSSSSFSVCPRCWGKWWNRQVFLTHKDGSILFFPFSFSVVTEFHHHPSTTGKEKSPRFLFRRVYFKIFLKMLIGAKCRWPINGRWLLAWFAPPTSQKKK